MPFLEHLEELRWRILWSLLALLGCAIVGFIVVTQLRVLPLLVRPIEPYIADGKLGYLSPADPFLLTLRLALIVGVLLAFPIIVYQVWSFLAPALHRHERRAIVPSFYLGLILFAGGMALAYFAALPVTLQFMMGFQTDSLRPMITAGPYLGFVVKLLLAFGLIFELPVVIVVLAAVGLVDTKMLRAKRRYAIIGAAVVAAFITPGDVVILTIFMMLPLILLYELSIGLTVLVERRRKRAAAAEAAAEAGAGAGAGAGVFVILALVAAFAAGPTAAAGQEPQPRSPTEQQRESIRRALRALERDTLAADSLAADTISGDTVSRVIARDSLDRELPTIDRDSIMRALLELEGYTAVEYSGSAVVYEADSMRILLEGPAVITQAGQSLAADSSVLYDRLTGVVCGYGQPVLSGTGATGSEPVESAQVCYDVERRIGVAVGARTRFTEGATWFLHGDVYTAGSERIYGSHAEFTTCDLEVPHYHFAAREMKVERGNVLVARDITLNFADVPVMWLPFMVQSLKSGRRSGLLMPQFSINDIARTQSGWNRRISNLGFYWAINDYMGAQVTGEWYANHWTALEGAFDYSWLSQFLNGGTAFRRYWQADGRRQLTLSNRTSWKPTERTDVRAHVNYASSSEFVRRNTFDPTEATQSIDSDVGGSQRFDWGTMTLSSRRKQFLSRQHVSTTLPELGLQLTSITLFDAPGTDARWYNNATLQGSGNFRRVTTDVDETLPGASFRDQSDIRGSFGGGFRIGNLSLSPNVGINRQVLLPKPGISDSIGTIQSLPQNIDERIDWSTSLSYNQRLIGTSTLTPQLTIRSEMIRSDSLVNSDTLPFQYPSGFIAAPPRVDFSASVATELFGFFPGVGPFSRFRHRLSPSVSYRYSPAIEGNALQRAVFGGNRGLSEANQLTFSIAQTFEAKHQETEPVEPDAAADTAAPADTAVLGETAAAAPDTATGPQRQQQDRKSMLLSIRTSALTYDFVRAREEGDGLVTTRIRNSLSSDLLRGFQVEFSHELFRDREAGAGADVDAGTGRDFAPYLSDLSAQFSLNNDSWIFRALGLGGAGDETEPAEPSAQDTLLEADEWADETSISGGEAGMMASADPERRRNPTRRSAGNRVGTWNASFTYSLFRPRPEEAALGQEGSQMLRGNLRFQPTTNWDVSWSTSYSFTQGEFSDHRLSLTRDLHEWQASFDFLRAQNGNFSMRFRVQLTDMPDLHLDYDQRSETAVGARPRNR
ncbi:MAG: twin-arginine translocase subunit TatC [Longimicrobiales bacterium]